MGPKFFLKFCFFILFYLGQSHKVAAQLDITFEQFTVENGLSQSVVHCMYQDNTGFLWFGTQDGLNRYDGYVFEKFKHNIHDTNPITGNWIYAMDGDRSDNLWIGTMSGLNKYDRRKNLFTSYFSNPTDTVIGIDSDIQGVLVGSDGKVWFRTSRVLGYIDTATNQIRSFKFHDEIHLSAFRNRGFPMVEDANKIWFGTRDGLIAFDRSNLRFFYFKHNPLDPYSLSDNFVTTVFVDKDKQLWVGTLNGLNLLDRKKQKFSKFQKNATGENSLVSNTVTSVFQDHNGLMWIGTEEGLSSYNASENVFKSYVYNTEGLGSVRNNVVLCITEDRMHNLWIGTEGGGLNKYNLKHKPFNIFRNSRIRGSVAISNNQIASIYADEKYIWVGTFGYGLNRIDRATKKTDVFSTKSEGSKKLVNNWVHVIYKDVKGLIWIGTRNGIHIYNPQTEKLKQLVDLYPFAGSLNLKNNRVYTLMEDLYKNMWIGTENGIYYISFTEKCTRTFSFNQGPSIGLLSNRIFSLKQQPDGTVWIGTSRGLVKYDPETHKYTQYMSKANVANSLTHNHVYCTHVDSDGYLWIGTLSGLNRMNLKTGHILQITTRNGLPHDLIYAVMEDQKGDIWVSTDHGLARIDKRSLKIRSYDDDDGLQGLEFNFGSHFKAADGQLFFGGQNGFNAFYPDSIIDNTMFAPIVFTWLEKISKIGSEKTSIEFVDKINLYPGDLIFTIEFSALDFTQPAKNHYQYRLEGVENEWIKIGTRKFATFSNLQPGTYRLEVKGSNSDGKWNPESKTLQIVIHPPFWQTNIAYFAYILFVVALIYLYIDYRTRNLKLSNQILREKHMAAIEIARQKEELLSINKSFTDSITYAKRIQDALIPNEVEFRKWIPDSFVLYMPKDIVSGDFYWVAKVDAKIFVATVDCTGHGVPGALMSIIGMDLLKNIVLIQKCYKTSEILTRLNKDIIGSFYEKGDGYVIKDGMDISLCRLDTETMKLEFSGAVNSLYYIRDERIEELKGNRYSIGSREENALFTDVEMDVKKGDTFYMFSDGYADQFGGSNGQKLKYTRFRHYLLSVYQLPFDAQRKFLAESFIKWKGTHDQVDDVMVVGFRV